MFDFYGGTLRQSCKTTTLLGQAMSGCAPCTGHWVLIISTTTWRTHGHSHRPQNGAKATLAG